MADGMDPIWRVRFGNNNLSFIKYPIHHHVTLKVPQDTVSH